MLQEDKVNISLALNSLQIAPTSVLATNMVEIILLVLDIFTRMDPFLCS